MRTSPEETPYHLLRVLTCVDTRSTDLSHKFLDCVTIPLRLVRVRVRAVGARAMRGVRVPHTVRTPTGESRMPFRVTTTSVVHIVPAAVTLGGTLRGSVVPRWLAGPASERAWIDVITVHDVCEDLQCGTRCGDVEFMRIRWAMVRWGVVSHMYNIICPKIYVGRQLVP